MKSKNKNTSLFKSEKKISKKSLAVKSPKPLKKQILVVDDHPMVRMGFVQLIGNEPDLEICGEAEHVSAALTIIAEKQPDLVITDISLPGRNGIELIKDLGVLHPKMLILVVSMHDEVLYADRALRAGARGYVMKGAGPAKLLSAIRWVLGGQIYVSEQMSSRVLEMLSNKKNGKTNSPIEKLTDREFEIFELIGQGMATGKIATQLHLSTKTVEAHRANIKAKLELPDGSALVRHAVRWVETQNLS
ncbi:MAG: response regulator transcription factor [Verrucomicrobiota bacterium]